MINTQLSLELFKLALSAIGNDDSEATEDDEALRETLVDTYTTLLELYNECILSAHASEIEQ